MKIKLILKLRRLLTLVSIKVVVFNDIYNFEVDKRQPFSFKIV